MGKGEDKSKGVYPYKVKGTYWDIIKTKLPNGEVRIEETKKTTNVITVPIRILMAALFKNEGAYSGVAYHAVGAGSVAWDTVPVAPTENDHPLVAEIFRKVPGQIDWIDPGTQQVVAGPTRIILVQTVFLYGDLNQAGEYIREQGLFGGTATGSVDSGEMIDCVRHNKIWKDSGIELIRNIKLEF